MVLERPQYLNVHFPNGKVYQFREDEGHLRNIEEKEGTILVHGWDDNLLAAVRQRAARVQKGDDLHGIDWDKWGDIDVVGVGGGANAEDGIDWEN